MCKIGQVDNEELSEMKEDIKEGKDNWIETVRRYNDPDVDLDDIWGWKKLISLNSLRVLTWKHIVVDYEK